MRFIPLALLGLILVPLFPGQSSADAILSYDFNATNDRQGWTVSSIRGEMNGFFFENLDELRWSATGGVGGTGGLWFVEGATWNYVEAFTAPEEALAAIRGAERPHLAYDLVTTNASGPHRIWLRGASGGLIEHDLGTTVLGRYDTWEIDLASEDLTWGRTGTSLTVAHSEVLEILGSLTGLYVRADHAGGNTVHQAILDNVTISDATVVPEPSSLALSSMGLAAGIGLWWRRCRSFRR